ncbi:hypothetical protein Ahy_A03g012200 [Arachis hypogaea]|uniref:Uncharacterized protein n=1 Tax=Arachis hypogaea TaxID=3818 RepID=A0A445DST2_ARAHY|nr:hypothetical protein Ahy_A03g012200 [Arachis hypogaea]
MTFYVNVYNMEQAMIDLLKLVIKRYNETIKLLAEADPSIKVKSVITKVQSKFNYTISYCKVWLVKQKTVEKIFGR